jgi:hypothetical protein
MTSFTSDRAAALPGPSWLVERRRAAAEKRSAAELPSTEEEVWRYSRVGDLTLDRYEPAAASDVTAPTQGTAGLEDLAGPDAVRIRTSAGWLADV